MTDPKRVRIGELSRRTGVSPALLRAWEQRYGLTEPARTPGGLRLYGAEDERRVRAMRRALARGLAAREAAQAIRDGPPIAWSRVSGEGDCGRLAAEMAQALSAADCVEAHRALDAMLSAFGFETVAREVLLPYLADLGRRWEQKAGVLAEEHLATQLLRGLLLQLLHASPGGEGRCVLACPRASITIWRC